MGTELRCPGYPWPPCAHSDMGADIGQAQRPPVAMGYSLCPACPQGQRKDEKALLINTDYVQRGDISTQPSTPRVSWPGGSQSPVGHSLSLPAQPGRGAPAPETFGLEPPAANTAPARVPSQGEPPWWHSPTQTFLGSLRGEQEWLQMRWNTAQGIPRGATVPQPPAISP